MFKLWRWKPDPYELGGEALRERAKESRVHIDDLVARYDGGVIGQGEFESEIRRRITEFERSKREHRAWVVSLCSAIAAVISAIAAWVAVCK
jgi:hypothetical protein